LTWRENSLDTPSPHSSTVDDGSKSVSLQCMRIVEREDRTKQVSGFAVETLDSDEEHTVPRRKMFTMRAITGVLVRLQKQSLHHPISAVVPS
jgi:hypothetical protein